ncbi:MAG: DNA-directed RNA polymerase subunit alpha [Candidatus Yanofskybacteria bacterium RIFCSPHIGHO2_01_FULL_43_42]|uniref:DNA-directed RNA polymerase subunit alpha n=1 Tax=Candidatus Yanofskybacteria bacterium RIFCSPLOWO2_01_FULL_43_22 TaxID=1802695 RepID=A0A1F8GD88_9BACT|nr:MAG: DNA-directed RNA polymerase subunit alpha [Candidatus Yanofskybacteria bacterium RIFCSPHIGHO2_01_FULL_43_42]OGN12710.1 MAG: DNA-directed RNA polymerase subunit alpha [Candidatus Yanofskybacteria bacterium RIFCSPHIGHO2_02_FULL_43_17]OGN23332.1 MAG: DNA-directed RNA polymerase subunit alpha [Candidatus Yanofskybacteria bacterium RIFCSPLOWO2_01_FULL_43_22]
MVQLPEQIKILKKEGGRATFEISPLMPGYGATIANPLRRVLLSSLEGVAVTSIKIKGVDHEFTTVPGVLEDVIQIILNVKRIRFKLFSDGPVKISLHVKGDKEVTAADIKTTSDVEVINPDQHIATLTDKKADFEVELDIERGIGYVPVEQRQKDKLAIGMIAIDAIFSPVRMVNFTVENVRVGQRIDFNKITMDIETDGSIEPEEALKRASEILVKHFETTGSVEIPEKKEEKPKKKAAKTKKAK